MARDDGRSNTDHLTVGAALVAATARLRDAGSPSARLDAEVLLAHLLRTERSWLLAHPEAPLTDPGAFDVLVQRRAAGEPVAYIRGFKEWHSLRIRTDARALIPRPETELLADTAVRELTDRLTSRATRVVAWDVGTGTGAVALVLARAFATEIARERVLLVASDISPEALDLAAENLASHGVADGVTLARADLLQPDGEKLPPPDVVVANLPYVPSAEVDSRLGSLGFEPRVALDGGPDGLQYLRELLAQARSHVAPGATILLETGVGQAPAIIGLAGAGVTATIVPDLAGLDRVLRLEMPD